MTEQMRRYKAPLRIVLVYVAVGAVWIGVSDWMLLALTPEHLRFGQGLKGIVFVLLSGLLIFLLVRREMHKRVRLEAEREDLHRRLAGSQRLEAIGRLTGGIAHDFNNLLTAISGNLESYLDRVAGETPAGPVPVELSEAASAARRAEDLTRQLLAFGRRQNLRPEPLDLNHVIRDMGQLLHRLIGDRIEIRTSLEEALWVVDVDRGPLQQVVMNLALNARDAMPDGGRLILATRNMTVSVQEVREGFEFPMVAGEYVRLRVEDTGTGMDADTRERIYEPFFTTKEKHVGTGLGMSTVYGIVKQSGGYIGLDSRPGRGTRFDLYFPRGKGVVAGAGETRGEASHEATPLPAADGAAGAAKVLGAPAPLRSQTVLVVEDEPAVRSVIIRTLEQRGFRTIECAGGEEALRVLQSSMPPSVDLLLTDAVMPGMSGPQLIQRMRALRPELPVLLMSGYSEEEFVSSDPYLPKPFTPDRLESRVREVLGRRQSL